MQMLSCGAWLELTETFLPLLGLVNHPDEKVAFSTEYRIYAHLKLDVAVEDVKRWLTKNYAML